jgi:hypothetical protein
MVSVADLVLPTDLDGIAPNLGNNANAKLYSVLIVKDGEPVRTWAEPDKLEKLRSRLIPLWKCDEVYNTV